MLPVSPSASEFWPSIAGAPSHPRAQIAAFRSETAAVTTFANAKDQGQLLGKLDNASAELTAGTESIGA